jgi:nudix-type nucleoside diphosphatase (YffH/AdpP family)
MVYEGWLRLLIAVVRYADGSTGERHVEDHGRAVAVLPYDAERRTVLLIHLPRAPVLYAGRILPLLEAAAGSIEDVEGDEVCARREALEEIGVRLTRLERVVELWSMPGVSTERVVLFLAPYTSADRILAGGGHPDEQEQITVLELGATQAWAMFQAGEISDAKTVILLMTLKDRRPDLF